MFDAIERGQHQDRFAEAGRPESIADHEAAHPGQDDVEHDEVVGVRPSPGQGLAPVTHEVDGVAVRLEGGADSLGDRGFILDDQYAQGAILQFSGPCRPGPMADERYRPST